LPARAAPCLTKTQAEKKFPNKHLYWHTDAKCWDAQAATKASRDKYESRPHRRQHDDSPPLPDSIPPRTKPIIAERHERPTILPLPENPTGPKFSDLDRPAPSAPPAEIAFPTMVHSEAMARPPFIYKPLPWFSPYPMTGWPQIYDVDEPDRFTVWRKRIE
jgi:hypothetical protein